MPFFVWIKESLVSYLIEGVATSMLLGSNSSLSSTSKAVSLESVLN